MSSGLMQLLPPKHEAPKTADARKAHSKPKGLMERRDRRRVALLGLGLTCAILVADLAGMLRAFEGWLYDKRARFCQRHLKPPSTDIVHIHIDDVDLEWLQQDLGRWPWSRAHLAEMLREIGKAKPKVLYLDLIFSEEDRQGPTTGPSPDEQLAAAIKEAGNVILPVSFLLKTREHSPLYRAMVDLFADKPELELTESELVKRVLAQGRFTGAEVEDQVRQLFIDARTEAIDRVLESSDLDDLDKLKHKLFPRTMAAQSALPAGQADLESPLFRLLKARADRARRVRNLKLKFLPAPEGFSLPESPIRAPPLLALSESAQSFGFVEYVYDAEGNVARVLPLVVSHGTRLVPHAGLAVACAMLDVKPNAIVVGRDQIVLHPPGRQPISIPLHSRDTEGYGRIGMLMDIPWFGRAERWDTIYDFPSHKQRKNQFTIGRVWEICRHRQRAAQNYAQARNLAADFRTFYDRELVDELRAMLKLSEAELTDLDQLAQRLERDLPAFIERGSDAERVDEPLTLKAAEGLKVLHARLAAARVRGPELGRSLERRADELLNDLRRDIEGKAVMVGYTSTDVTDSDVVTTSLHKERTPGVMVLSTVCNGLLSGELWRRVPHWINFLITAAMGLAVTACVVYLRPSFAIVAAALLLMAYVLLNGELLFDRSNLIVTLAAPVTCAGVVWSGTTARRYYLERKARRFITKRLGGYVDTPLVEYVLSHPDQTKFDGEIRQLTIVYTDLAGFSALTEQLREKTVPLLNAYMGRMVPLIHQNKGYVDKFLGDGIMFFFGAPWRQEDHAIKAVQTVLDMHEALNAFNEESIERPALRMRAGVSTGNVIVGDAGPDDACDYTVLGEAANLGKRLETANKLFGSRTLVGESTRELLEGRFLLRLLGRLRPIGLNETLRVYEPLCRAEAATDADRQLVRMTHDAVEPFMAGRYKDALEAVTRMEESQGESRFTKLYRRLCERYLREPPGAGFDGTIDQDDRD